MCADLLRWVPLFLRTVYSAQFCLHRCRSWPRPSCAFRMLSVDWYVRNRIKHVHPVSDRVTLDADWARQDTRLRLVSCRPSLHLELPSDTGWTCQILYIPSALAMEILQSCTEQSISYWYTRPRRITRRIKWTIWTITFYNVRNANPNTSKHWSLYWCCDYYW